MDVLNTILNIVFPSYCISCGKSGSLLCNICLTDSPHAERESDKWIYPLYDYRHPLIKKAIWLLKYKSKKSLARTFAEAMYPYMLEEINDLAVFENFKDALIIPIPLSKNRRKERGFNQTELIAKALIKLDKNINFEIALNILMKYKETTRQAHIKVRKARLRNLIGTFIVRDPEIIRGRNIILIDDVTTTGATLKEAKSSLKKSGARKIIAFTVAH